MLENRDKRGAGEFHAIGNDEKRVFLPFFHGCRVPDVNVLDAFGIGISCLEDFLFDLFRTVRRIFHFEGAAVSAAASIARVHRGLHFIGIGVVTEERSRCASGDELDGARGEFLENIHSRPFPVCPLLACEHEESLRSSMSFLKAPETDTVLVRVPGFLMPRAVMQECSPSIRTATSSEPVTFFMMSRMSVPMRS